MTHEYVYFIHPCLCHSEQRQAHWNPLADHWNPLAGLWECRRCGGAIAHLAFHPGIDELEAKNVPDSTAAVLDLIFGHH